MLTNAPQKHSYQDRLLFPLWRAMLARCEDPAAPEYPYFGARGISIDPRWHIYRLFILDMAPLNFIPQPPATTLTRINPDGNYEKSNCQWKAHQSSSFAPELEKVLELGIDTWLVHQTPQGYNPR